MNSDSIKALKNISVNHNLFSYCANNPISYYDSTGMSWEEIKEAIRKSINLGHAFFRDLGFDTAAMGAFLLMMTKDSEGIYHADFECWQQYFGYNDFYDFVFDLGTSMKTAKFPFEYNGTSYIIWAWKSDYINLGAGAEIGIYYGGDPHWLVDKNLAMSMCLYLSYNNKYIIRYTDGGYQWWCTGFNPSYQNVKASDLIASFTMRFDDPYMYKVFRNTYKYDKRWFFYILQGFGFASFTF